MSRANPTAAPGLVLPGLAAYTVSGTRAGLPDARRDDLPVGCRSIFDREAEPRGRRSSALA